MSAKLISLNRTKDDQPKGMVIVMVNKGNPSHFLELTEEINDAGDVVVMQRTSSNQSWVELPYSFKDLPETVQYWATCGYKVKWTVME